MPTAQGWLEHVMVLNNALLMQGLSPAQLPGCTFSGNESVGAVQGHMVLGKPPRIGVDLGGVLNKHNNDVMGDTSKWHMLQSSEVPGAMDSMAELVRAFGPQNVFIVSKVGRMMEALSQTWLHQTMNICGRTGLLRENIHFCRECTGPQGKGVVAATLGLSHFVDDKDENLWSVYNDPAGNSRCVIDQLGGLLFHFARSGVKSRPPMPCKWPLEQRPACVIPVANWAALMMELRRRIVMLPTGGNS